MTSSYLTKRCLQNWWLFNIKQHIKRLYPNDKEPNRNDLLSLDLK